ncbi:helix-turn-helix transcriptional regulator [Lacrimispora sp. 38-1]|uniref:helix-turn-helix transcriptional regulator n=1 Tax=Lacrimispora sp. 38-1 TaxID=3125778 RepID=UPI003CF3EFE6
MDIITLLTKYFKSTHIPITLYDCNNPIYFFDPNASQLDIAHILLSTAATPNTSPDAFYTLSSHYLYCGLIHLNDTQQYITIGPIAEFAVSAGHFKETLLSLNLDTPRSTELLNWFQSVPLMTGKQFIAVLEFLQVLLNDKNEPIPYFPCSDSPYKSTTLGKEPDIPQALSPQMEIEILAYIRYGKTKEIKKLWNTYFSNNDLYFTPSVTCNQTYQDIFICSAVLASRSAIRGGLDFSMGVDLLNKYISKFRNLNSSSAIINLLNNMFLDFAEQARKVQELPASSPTIKKVSRFVQSHLYEKISTCHIANELNMSEAFLCRHFKQQTGMTLTEYINLTKITESKLLLETSDLSLAQIAVTLGYSSQNYYQSVFKKLTGTTPTQYRENIH